jgi:hypothetical protein
VDTDTQLAKTDIEGMGFVDGAHTVDTDTQLAKTDIETMGFVDGAHTIDTHADQTEIEGLGFVTGAHTIDTDTQLSETEVDAFVANNGYSTGAHTVDTDTQLAKTDIETMGFVDGAHTVDTNTQLSEAEVDAFVANNGYSTGAHTIDTNTQLTNAEVATAVNTEFPNLDTDATDDYNTGITFDGTNLTITDNGGNQTIDISSLAYDDTVINDDIDNNAAAITAHNTADGDLSDSNEIQTLSITGNDLSISGVGGNMVTLPSISGTSGSVFFADTDGTQTENNSQLFWDNTNNRLGIGTTSPTHKLQVSGQVRATSFANANGTAGSPSYRFNDDGNTGMYRADTDQLGFSTAGTEALRIDGSQNIGVGDFSSDTVDASLHVKSDTGVPLKIEPSTSTPTGTSGGQMFVSDDDGILYIYDGTRLKWLSIDRTMIGWGRNSASTTNEYLRQFNGALSSQNGWRMVRNGTITAISAQSNINQTWTFEIRRNDATTVIASITMTGVQGNHDNTLNVDINEGDYIQAFCNGTSVDYPETLIEIAWRK